MSNSSFNPAPAFVVLLLLVVALPVFALVQLVVPIRLAVEETEGGWERFTSDDLPGWVSGAIRSLPGVLNPVFAVRVMGSAVLLPVIASCAVLFVWRRSQAVRPQGAERALQLLLATAPVLVGALWAIYAMRQTLSLAAEVGLTNPVFVGEGLGETFAGPFIGLYLGAILVLLFRLRSRLDCSPSEDAQ